MKKIGFIGCGNMAKAMIGGIVGEKLMAPEEILASNRSRGALDYAKETWGISVTGDNRQVARESEILVLAVKPQFYSQVIAEIREDVREDQIVMSIAPGKTLKWFEEQFGRKLKFVRCNPNTPALVGEGITSVSPAGKLRPGLGDAGDHERGGDRRQRERAGLCFHVFGGHGRRSGVSRHAQKAGL